MFQAKSIQLKTKNIKTQKPRSEIVTMLPTIENISVTESESKIGPDYFVCSF